MPQTRQLAAIMFTDIVGYTALMGNDEQKAFDLLNKNRQLQKPIIEQYGGKWIKELGDGVMASFSTVSDAVNAAIKIQKECNKSGDFKLRIGIHLGEVVFENEDVFGDGVNIASRIQAVAPVGGIYISEAVHNNIANKKDIITKFVHAETLKNVREPVRIYEVIAEGIQGHPVNTLPHLENRDNELLLKRKKIIYVSVALLVLVAVISYYLFVYQKPGADKNRVGNSIAVLYFDNMSGDSTQEYFSDGMTEEIITRLSGINGLKVKSRTSVLQYKKQSKNLKQIASELGINHILEGSVRKQGNMVLITAHLINALTDENIWSENYDRELKDIFKVQSDIAQQIANRFQVNLTDDNKKKLETSPTLNTDAYDLYLKARSLKYLGDGTGNNLKQANVFLKQAIKLDESFSDAYAALAENYVRISANVINPKSWIDTATQFANKSIKISPGREAGYSSMAAINIWKGQYNDALKWLFKANDILPSSNNQNIADVYLRKNEYGNAYEWVNKTMTYDPAESEIFAIAANIFLQLGLFDSSKSYIDKARRLTNRNSDMDWSARTYYLLTQNEYEFIALCKKAFALDEKAFNTQMCIFYTMQKNWKRVDSLSPISSVPYNMDAGLTKIHLGKKVEGGNILKKAIELRKSFLGFADEWHNYDISRCYAALQDGRYIIYLNTAIEKGWHHYAFFEHDPFFYFVRHTPQFKRLRQKAYKRNEGFKEDLFKAIKRLNK